MNKIINSSLIFFLSLAIVFGIFTSTSLAADYFDPTKGVFIDETPVSTGPTWCNSTTNLTNSKTSKYAPWNIDKSNTSTVTALSTPFECRAISMSRWTETGYTMPKLKVNPCPGLSVPGCTNKNDCFIRCTRKADCVDIGGECKTSVDAAYKSTHHQITLRCDKAAENTCWVPNPPTPPPATPTVPPPYTAPPPIVQEPKALPRVSLNNCCSQLVPSGAAYVDGNYGVDHIIQVIINIYNCILCMVAALMLLMFVLGAFTFMTSAGNQSRVDQGKKIITAAVIGGIIVFASVLIVNFAVKAIGGGFTNEARLEVNVGAPAPSSASAPSTAGTLSTTQPAVIQQSGGTGNTTNTGTNPKKTGFTQEQKKVLEETLQFASTDNQQVYDLITTAFNHYSYDSKVDTAQYEYIPNSADCQKTVFLGNGFFANLSQDRLIETTLLVHEATHYDQCVSGLLDSSSSCAYEQLAYSAVADYLESHAKYDVALAHGYRCDWNQSKTYTEEKVGDPNYGKLCVPYDKKC